MYGVEVRGPGEEADGAVVLAGAQVGSNRIAAGAVVIGMPAIAKEKFFEQVRQLHRLKKLFADVAELKARLGEAKESE